MWAAGTLGAVEHTLWRTRTHQGTRRYSLSHFWFNFYILHMFPSRAEQSLHRQAILGFPLEMWPLKGGVATVCAAPQQWEHELKGVG